jgi:hypothetical protein
MVSTPESNKRENSTSSVKKGTLIAMMKNADAII